GGQYMSQSNFAAILEPGTRYIVVDSFDRNQSGELTLNVQHLPFVGQDSPADHVSAGPYTLAASQTDDALATDNPSCVISDTTHRFFHERWYYWFTCPDDSGGLFVAQTCNAATTADTVLLLRHGGSSASAACDDDDNAHAAPVGVTCDTGQSYL